MTKICYIEKSFRDASLAIIDQANAILDEFARDKSVLRYISENAEEAIEWDNRNMEDE